jgi:(2S)-methylsuccinyl-CoA dehydrogenase
MSATAASTSEIRTTATALIAAALPGFEALLQEAIAAVRQKVLVDGKISASQLEIEQHAAHGLSWLATYVMALREMKAYGERLQARIATARPRILPSASAPANMPRRSLAASR